MVGEGDGCRVDGWVLAAVVGAVVVGAVAVVWGVDWGVVCCAA